MITLKRLLSVASAMMVNSLSLERGAMNVSEEAAPLPDHFLMGPISDVPVMLKAQEVFALGFRRKYLSYLLIQNLTGSFHYLVVR